MIRGAIIMTTTLLKLNQITVDTKLQVRAEINSATVAEYTAALVEGAKFPPVVVEQKRRKERQAA